MSFPLIHDIRALARAKKSFRERLSYLLRGFIFLPFLMRDFSGKTGQTREAGGSAPQFDDIYPLF